MTGKQNKEVTHYKEESQQYLPTYKLPQMAISQYLQHFFKNTFPLLI